METFLVRTAIGPAIPAPCTEHAEGFHRSAAQGGNAKKLPDEQAKHAIESPPILGQSHQGDERTVQTEVDDQKRRVDFDGRRDAFFQIVFLVARAGLEHCASISDRHVAGLKIIVALAAAPVLQGFASNHVRSLESKAVICTSEHHDFGFAALLVDPLSCQEHSAAGV